MLLPNNFTANQSAGFTLLEILIVMALLSLVGALALMMSMDDYRGYAFRNERNTLVAALHDARSQAINTLCFGTLCTNSKPHGVYIQNGEYIIFQGATFASRDTSYDVVIPGNTAVQRTGVFEIVFLSDSGQANPNGSVTLSDQGLHESTVSINPEGQITWAH